MAAIDPERDLSGLRVAGKRAVGECEAVRSRVDVDHAARCGRPEPAGAKQQNDCARVVDLRSVREDLDACADLRLPGTECAHRAREDRITGTNVALVDVVAIAARKLRSSRRSDLRIRRSACFSSSQELIERGGRRASDPKHYRAGCSATSRRRDTRSGQAASR